MKLLPLGDSAVVLELAAEPDVAALRRVRTLAESLSRIPIPGTVEVLPAFGTVTVFLDVKSGTGVREVGEALLARAAESASGAPFDDARVVEIEVCYGGAHGPDLAIVAAKTGLSPEEVIARHSGASYRVLALGFTPGFAYLGGLPPELVTPRHATPRTRVPEGSVGIGGRQTGIYPQSTPGGWNLIGRTPRRLFRPELDEPALFRLGDRVRIKCLTPEEFKPEQVPAVEASVQNADGACLEVVRAGPLTTVQDLGRVGHRASGMPLAGAADSFALRVANLLVGNPESAAGLECALVGPEIVFPEDTVIAVAGAGFESIPLWRPIKVRAGERIAFGPIQNGCRAYIAISGGIDVPMVLGSRSTYLPAGLGGFHGRVLAAGDRVPVNRPLRRDAPGRWSVDRRMLPDYGPKATIRVLRGAHADRFGGKWIGTPFTVTRQFDRMGVRLKGPPVASAEGDYRNSGVVAPGTVQVPGDGAPIILLTDSQTIGGYPRLAHVIAPDLPVVAQLRGGNEVQFAEVSQDQAEVIRFACEQGIAILREGVARIYGKR
jgi:KipI family sensor histidine kinase inhibitor